MIYFPLIAGFLASMLHVISGPDHLAAVTPLAIETDKKAWKIGLFWGVGHVLGMLLIGILFLFFKQYIPIESISEHSEQLVGVVLVGVGIWVFYKLSKEKKSSASLPALNKPKLLSSFGIGILHGLAGVAHFLLLLPVLGFEADSEGVLYIIGFAAGTILAMIIYTSLLTRLVYFSKRKGSERLFHFIRLSGGVFATVIGIYWLYLGA